MTIDTTTDVRNQVNDCAIKLANVNGTGSASANSLLMQAIFRMGIPVSGKNLFPSNIQGLPTWYEIRVNKDGYTSRSLNYDLMVAMNSQTYAEDIADVRHGGYVIFDSSWPLDPDLERDDVTFLGVPLAKMCLDNFKAPRERILMKNIAYAGVIVALLGIDLDVVASLLAETFAKNERLVESNQRALHLGYDYAMENLTCPLPFHVEPMDANGRATLINGNMATALGCLYAGATVAGWYPITPATAVMDNFIRLCARYRREPVEGGEPGEHQNNYLILQAEDEIAAIGMVLGASWSGARSFTSTSGPGISLMNELLGLAYYTDFPANPHECFDFAVASFDLAEHFQTPVFMLSDLDIGMNDWVVPELKWDDAYVPDRGPVLADEDLAEMAEFFRYANENPDHVASRTLPGSMEKGAYFIRGSGHDQFGKYTENPVAYQQVVDRLKLKHASAAAYVPAPVELRRDGAAIGIITL